ncbi:MAG: hypothetical protein JWP97_4536 [Labilithrix sp.]|nr:hypothetical protein [Labilithrix sp.]
MRLPRGTRSTLLTLAPLALTLFLGCSSDDAPTAGPSDAATPPGADHDAAPGDAGVPAPDAAPPADAALPDPCAGRAVCDSFESAAPGGKPDPATWKVLENSGTVTVSDARAHTGTHSVKLATTMAQYQRAMIQTAGAPLFPLPGNTLYGRMWVYLENAAAHSVHWNMISAGGAVPGHSGVTAVYDYGGQLDVLLALYDTQGAKTDCGTHSARAMPIGTWTCFAWAYKGPTNEMQLFDQAGEITDMHVVNKGQQCLSHDLGDQWIAPTFANASVGWESVQTDAGHTMYIDDVILDDEPVSCP